MSFVINPYRFGGGGGGGLPTGVIVEYLFNSGTTTTPDTSGNGYDLDMTLFGNADVSNAILELDGTGDYATTTVTTDIGNLSFTDDAGNDDPFSISCWVRSSVAVSAQNIVVKGNVEDDATFEYQFQFLGGGNAGKLALTLYDDANKNNIIYAIGTTAYTINEWCHCVVTYDGGNSQTGINIYRNGSLDTTTRATAGTYGGMGSTTEPLQLGARKSSSSYGVFLTGDMEDVRIYDKELTSGEVTTLWNDRVDLQP